MAPSREAGRRDAESQGQAAGAEGPRCARQPRMPDPFLDPQSAMPAGAALAHSGGGLDRGRRGRPLPSGWTVYRPGPLEEAPRQPGA